MLSTAHSSAFRAFKVSDDSDPVETGAKKAKIGDYRQSPEASNNILAAVPANLNAKIATQPSIGDVGGSSGEKESDTVTPLDGLGQIFELKGVQLVHALSQILLYELKKGCFLYALLYILKLFGNVLNIVKSEREMPLFFSLAISLKVSIASKSTEVRTH